jgi:hypothetical protein
VGRFQALARPGPDTAIQVASLHRAENGISLGLLVESERPFPLAVGCSLRTTSEEILDFPSRRLDRPGLAWWGLIGIPQECRDQKGNTGITPASGDIIFAAYADATQGERLADTGWVPWNVELSPGMVKGFYAEEGEPVGAYGSRQWPGSG